MAIGATMREDGALKLVHRGGYVEVHTEPLTAAQVMNKNPRHCITRPDIFKFPWIVVRPESVLQLGRVFYIVPNRTIYRLLHRNSLHRQSPSPQKHQASRNHDHYRQFKKQFQDNSSAEVGPKSEQHDQHLRCKPSDGYQLDHHKQQFPCEPLSKSSKNLDSDGHINQQSMVQSQVKTTPKIDEHARHSRREVRVKSYSKASLKHQDYYRDSKQFQSWAKVTPLIQDSAMPNSRIEMTPKHRVRGYRIKQKSPTKRSSKTTNRDQYRGRHEQQSATYSWNEMTKKEDHSKTFKEHSAVSSETTTRDQYHGRLEQQSATYSWHEVTEKEDHRKKLIEHSAVSDETTTRDQYHVPLEQKSATRSWHKVTKKEDHRKRFKEHSEVDPCVQERPSHTKTQDIDDSSGGGRGGLESPTKQDRGLPELKSCLQRKGSDQRSRNLRVTFSLSSENAGKAERSRNRFCC